MESQLLVCRWGEYYFALPLELVAEVQRMVWLAPPVMEAEEVLGSFVLRGKIMKVISPAYLLALPYADGKMLDSQQRLVIFQEYELALQVDEVLDVLQTSAAGKKLHWQGKLIECLEKEYVKKKLEAVK